MGNPAQDALLKGALNGMRDPGVEDELNALREAIATDSLQSARTVLVRLEDAYRLMAQRWADKELVRAGHVLAVLCNTPTAYYAAVREARIRHPEAWAGSRAVYEKPKEKETGTEQF